jgi:hypothetical protein
LEKEIHQEVQGVVGHNLEEREVIAGHPLVVAAAKMMKEGNKEGLSVLKTSLQSVLRCRMTDDRIKALLRIYCKPNSDGRVVVEQ